MKFQSNEFGDMGDPRIKGRILIRQSWLGDLMTCPERARFKLTHPHMSGPSDATIMGTAVHYGIEQVLNNWCDTASIGDVSMAHFERLRQEPYKETNLNPDKYETHIRSMCDAFVDGILPYVELGGETEYKFAVPTGLMVDDWTVWIEGTMDYITPNGVMWDWKTASRAYNAREKQSTSLQATVYAMAMNQLGLAEYPAEFNFGVMIRQDKPKSQIVRVTRNASHANWAKRHMKVAVEMALRQGIKDTNWVMNESSNLCSERWCSYWSICKGGYLSPSDIEAVPVHFPTTGTDIVPDNNEPNKEG